MLVMNAFLLYTTLTPTLSVGGFPRKYLGRHVQDFSHHKCRQSGAIRMTIAPVGNTTMEWTTPQFEEICLNCEINTYASASL